MHGFLLEYVKLKHSSEDKAGRREQEKHHSKHLNTKSESMQSQMQFVALNKNAPTYTIRPTLNSDFLRRVRNVAVLEQQNLIAHFDGALLVDPRFQQIHAGCVVDGKGHRGVGCRVVHADDLRRNKIIIIFDETSGNSASAEKKKISVTGFNLFAKHLFEILKPSRFAVSFPSCVWIQF